MKRLILTVALLAAMCVGASGYDLPDPIPPEPRGNCPHHYSCKVAPFLGNAHVSEWTTQPPRLAPFIGGASYSRPAQCPGGNCPNSYYGGNSNWQGFGNFPHSFGRWSGYHTEEDQSFDVPVPEPDDQPRRIQKQTPVAQWQSNPPLWLVNIGGATGMLVAKGNDWGLVLTAYHMVEGTSGKSVSVRFAGGETLVGSVIPARAGEPEHISGGRRNVAVDRTADISFIQTTKPKAEPCLMATQLPRARATVYIIGYGAGRYRCRQGNVKGYSRSGYRGSTLEDDGTIVVLPGSTGGDSGGAIITERGELCGVVSQSPGWQSLENGQQTYGQYTTGASLTSIYRLCTDSRFKFPFGFRQNTREELENHEGRLGQLEDDDSPLPPPPTPPTQKPYDDGPLLERITKLEMQVEAATKGLDRVDVIIEEVKTTAQNLAGSGDEQKRALAAEITGIEGRVKATLAEQVSEATQTATTKAEAAASAAVEKATPGLLDKVRGLLPERLATRLEGLHTTTATLAKGLLANRAALIFLGAGLVIIVLIDVVRWVKTGGKDKLILQGVMDRLDRVAERTRNPYDDYVLNAAKGGVDASLEKALALARNLGWAPPEEVAAKRKGTT